MARPPDTFACNPNRLCLYYLTLDTIIINHQEDNIMDTHPTGMPTESGPANTVKLNVFEKAFLDAYDKTRPIRESLRTDSAKCTVEQTETGGKSMCRNAITASSSGENRG